MLRLVLDTNVWLDWLLFDDPGIAALRTAVAAGRAEVIVDEAGEAELVRVLGYAFSGKTLTAERQAELLAQCQAIARPAPNPGSRTTNDAARPGNPLPKCADTDDQKFLELALACGAAFLVTRDGDLLDLARRKASALPCRIVTPQELTALLTGIASPEETSHRR